MYLSKRTIAIGKFISFIQIVAGITLITLLSMGLVLNSIDEGNWLENILVGIILIGALGTMTYLGIKTKVLIANAKKYNSIFMSDIDGKVNINELSLKMGIHSYKIIRLIDKLIGRGYLINCAINYENDPTIVLMDDGTNLAHQYEMMRCPRCGCDMKVRKGFFTTCEHCGIEIKI